MPPPIATSGCSIADASISTGQAEVAPNGVIAPRS